ncbi:VC2046/SO_2500 family protein [Vibrio hippocampi]|uniref:Queuosine biosynthesis protein QueD n=1 Tax=Vibrio hippocampi TaxID=654686 RepID=A0ABN8DFB8_9VIBR|nr:VC2046/SO_2500 family protein [Vibrio hippocampi]CAH0525490.1 hypothetical protein VHP8226_01015 [Vibrio hippocampi]
MQIHRLDTANLINELQCGSSLSQAVEQGRRADFSLLLSMLSQDCRETSTLETGDHQEITESELKAQLGIAEPQRLKAETSDYENSAKIANLFHQGGLAGAKLQHYVKPEPLSYSPAHTHGFSEDVYQNLSGHTRRQLSEGESRKSTIDTLYLTLAESRRTDQISVRL